jgi:hypothetical protein
MGVHETLEETREGISMATTGEFTSFQVPVQNWSPLLLGDLGGQIAKQLDKRLKKEALNTILHNQDPYVLTHGKQKVVYRVRVEATGYAPAFAGNPAKWSLTLWAWS